jgi:[protein-PII] uridylyltransferase
MTRDVGARFQSEPPRWPAWREFFSQPHVAMALRQMQETGMLTAAIPHWNAIECLVVRDFYHRYTVDEHSIVAVEVIDQLVKQGRRAGAVSESAACGGRPRHVAVGLVAA